MFNILLKSLKDILSFRVLLFVTKTAGVALGFAGFFIWLFEDAFSFVIHSYLAWIPWEWLQTSGATVITWSIAYTIFLVIVMILNTLKSKTLLIALAQKHYPNIKTKKSNIAISLFMTLKSMMIFFMLFMMLMPFLPIPILGQGLMLYLMSLLVRKPIYKIGSMFSIEKQLLKSKTKNSNKIAFIALLFNYIPIFNIFAPIFRQIVFLHYVLEEN